MKRKSLCLTGVILLLFAMQSCTTKPEQSLLKRYFQAIAMNDTMTMSTMALEPIKLDVVSWEIVNVSEEVSEPASLPRLDKEELEFKKRVEDSVGITMEAREILLDAEYERDNARTRRAKNTLQKKVDELDTEYKEIRATHDQLQVDYNMAKTASSKEEEITIFSLGAGDIPNARELTGDVHFKKVELKIQGKESTKNYKFYLRQYVLKDELLNINRRGRWIIVKIELLA
ncbi:MAG: hypothetical protein GQ536_03745 [Candidatus Aminicenantes bacterium]|nr:hypothetical protein [Candidatus Aminicenantes bacterium]